MRSGRSPSARTTQHAGGLIGYNTGGEVKTSFWDAEASGVAVGATGTGLTTIQMQQASTFLEVGWDFADTWTICEGRDYPRLRWEKIVCDQP